MAKRVVTAEDMAAYQAKHNYQRICGMCVRYYYESLVGRCPQQNGREVCMYCCRLCPEHYQGFMGQGCRARDRKKKT